MVRPLRSLVSCALLLLALGLSATGCGEEAPGGAGEPAQRGPIGKSDEAGSCAATDCTGQGVGGRCYCDAECVRYGDCCGDRAAVCGGGGGGTGPQALDPAGIYFNAFSGGFSGAEWFEVVSIGPGRYSMTDIAGGGFDGTVSASGAVTLDRGVGSGEFTSADAFVIRPDLGGSVFTFDSTRAPFTTSSFPLRATTRVNGDPALAGAFQSQTTYHDARTGAEVGAGGERLELRVSGSTLRITDPQGAYFQGHFASSSQAVFRVVSSASRPEFSSFAGSQTNAGQDVLGEVVFSGADAFTGTVLLQSRAPLGQQTQVVVRFDATRL